MKNKKGFTLIELLAIIVILAIIAVITVPIILNIIEKSKEGAVVDSAYGYKNGVEQYYISKAVSTNQDENLTKDVTKTVSQLENDGLTVSGEKPSDGWVKLVKGQVVDYSLKFGDYIVSLDTTTNAPVSTKNGTLKTKPSTAPTIETCPGCVFFYTTSYVTSSMPDTTDDYRELISSHPYFLGVIESTTNPGTIERKFACGIEGTTPFCLENNSSKWTDGTNPGILNTIFPGCNANSGTSNATCTGATISAKAKRLGLVDVYDSTGWCYADGSMLCGTN